jgi:t-SNARE complex subunit (syntaxin)
MSSQEPLIALLTEIRDLQREHLELYRKQSEQAEARVQLALAKQEQALAGQGRALEFIERFRKRGRLLGICIAVIVIALVVLRLLPH